MAVEIGAFEYMRAAKDRYMRFAYWSAVIPTSWDSYLAGFKAGGVFEAHTSGRLLDPEVVLAVHAIARVFDVAPEQADETDECFRAGAAWMAATSGKLSGPEFRLAIQVLAEAMGIERGPTPVPVCVHCGAVG